MKACTLPTLFCGWTLGGERGYPFFLFAELKRRRRLPGRFIASADSVKALGIRKKDQVLACQYNQKFSLGTLNLELIPSGSFFGSASFCIFKHKKDTFMPNLLTDVLPITRRMELKKS